MDAVEKVTRPLKARITAGDFRYATVNVAAEMEVRYIVAHEIELCDEFAQKLLAHMFPRRIVRKLSQYS
ncbi:MAG TPA: hypothetical protein VM221_00345 [Armatimonadota bacterium]|nr:hypothetical protein [Armatimonadota bacterium]